MGEVKESKAVAIYHRIMRRENFETAAKDLFRLLAEAQKKEPGRKRVLYLDIDGHKNQAGGFDEDMFELQRHFIVEFLLPYFSEVHIPLGSFVNKEEQRNDIPDQLDIFNSNEKEEDSLDRLYLENYSNTEFMSEKDVYKFLEHVAEFLRHFCELENEADGGTDGMLYWLSGWRKYIKDLIMELFNSFVYGDLITVSAMTGALIESYVYLRVMEQEKSGDLVVQWCLCSIIRGIKVYGEGESQKLLDTLKQLCDARGMDYGQCVSRFKKGNANSWLTELLQKKSVTFRDVCEYLGEPEIYADFQMASGYIHGQDIITKTLPFTFYSSIYHKLYIMMEYIFRTVEVYPGSERLDDEMQTLENELIALGKNYA